MASVNVPAGLRKDLEVVSKLLRGENGGALWEVLTAMRGPDFPSERPNMTGEESSRAYKGRRDRKYKTGEVLRAVALPGATPGARSHLDTKVILPPPSTWDHYDKHVERAAKALGLEVVIEEPRKVEGEVKVSLTTPSRKLEAKVKELLGEKFDPSLFVNKADEGEPSVIKVVYPVSITDANVLKAALGKLGVVVEWLPNPNRPPTPEWMIQVLMDYYGLTTKSAEHLILTRTGPWPPSLSRRIALCEYMASLGMKVDVCTAVHIAMNSSTLNAGKAAIKALATKASAGGPTP